MELKYNGGENFNLRDMLKEGKNLCLKDRAQYFSGFLSSLHENGQNLCQRQIVSAADREVEVIDPFNGQRRKMLMFGSNNYLGLANHPYVLQKTREAIEQYGVGIGGPPLLNGYTCLHRELEERLSHLKQAEDTLIFPSGYGANVGLVAALLRDNDKVFYDEYSHASFCDGLRMSGVSTKKFQHNNMMELRTLLRKDCAAENNDTFIGVEGVYSMDGDLAPLNELASISRRNGALLILDDAHGTGVMGKNGHGTAEHFGVQGQIDITMGTFSKAFGVVGGFVSASKQIVNYLRYFARSYMFSASLPPPVIGAVLAGLDVIENEPELIQSLHENVKYAASGLQNLGFDVTPQAAIIALRVPPQMNIRKAARHFHEAGIFVNSIEYPAVPVDQQRFRISLMATHTKEDIDQLCECIEEVWSLSDCNTYELFAKAI